MSDEAKCLIYKSPFAGEEGKMSHRLQENKDVVLRALRETDLKNFDVWDEVAAPDFVARFANFPEPFDLAGYKEAVTQFNAVGFPDFKHEFLNVVAEGDWVFVHMRVTGTHKGALMGIPPTGRKVDYEGMISYRVVGGKIVELHGIADFKTLMTQLGS
jgi:predicted ester cyclase